VVASGRLHADARMINKETAMNDFDMLAFPALMRWLCVQKLRVVI
jgi:hypothetical protein